jgi:hypothetical protein
MGCRELALSVGLHKGFDRVAIKADENVNHSAVSKNEFIVYRIKLTVKSHPLPTVSTQRPIRFLQEFGITTELMPSANVVFGILEF